VYRTQAAVRAGRWAGALAAVAAQAGSRGKQVSIVDSVEKRNPCLLCHTAGKGLLL